jgi:hypothetical protein
MKLLCLNYITTKHLRIFNFYLWIIKYVIVVIYVFYYFNWLILIFLFWFWRSTSSHMRSVYTYSLVYSSHLLIVHILCYLIFLIHKIFIVLINWIIILSYLLILISSHILVISIYKIFTLKCVILFFLKLSPINLNFILIDFIVLINNL